MEDLQTKFLRVHLAHQRALFAYLLAAVREPARAEDLLQEVTLVLWKRFGEYREELPYAAWAFGVARRELAMHFRERGKEAAPLSLEILDRVAPALEAREEELSAESRALHGCVEKLAPPHRDLLRLRYQEGLPLRTVSERLGQSLAAVNMKIVRLRKALLDCTRRALSGEAAS
jgi:RNA polymerase sigma-70 factor (ECF subfamily)